MPGLRSSISLIALAGALLALPGGAVAQEAGTEPEPIPGSPLAIDVEPFVGSPATADPHRRLRVPRHPFMAPNPLSNIHNDAYQSDVYNRPGPLGEDMETSSALFTRECASVTFDRRGRIVTVCVGLDRPVLAVLDPETFEPYSTMDLPPRDTGSGNPFSNFAGGGYFYLDHRDRAVVPTSERHILVVRVTGAGQLVVRRDFDLSARVPDGDAIIAVMPDWRGRIWFATTKGRVGFVTRRGRIAVRATGEPIGNSFAVDERGGVYIVTNGALYRFQAGRRGRVRTIWRQPYPNVGEVKPGQTQAGSGTTPTLMGRRLVAITDNAEHMAVRVYQRTRRARGKRLVCRQRVFDREASSTDQSLIATRRSIVVENNYGYTGVAATMNGATTTPGLERVDLDGDGRGCDIAWHSDEISPSAVPKLSLRSGLVYTYTKPERDDVLDAWYLTAIDFDNGKTRWRRLAGTGFGYNNNFAPITLARGAVARPRSRNGISVSNPVQRMTTSGSKLPPSANTARCPSKRAIAPARRHLPVTRAVTHSSDFVPNCSWSVPPDSASSSRVSRAVARSVRV